MQYRALTTAALVAAITTFSGVSATTFAMDDVKCKAEFAKADANRDERLKDDENRDYDQVKSQVDVNKDGEISADEYIVACKQGILDKVRKSGG